MTFSTEPSALAYISQGLVSRLGDDIDITILFMIRLDLAHAAFPGTNQYAYVESMKHFARALLYTNGGSKQCPENLSSLRAE